MWCVLGAVIGLSLDTTCCTLETGKKSGNVGMKFSHQSVVQDDEAREGNDDQGEEQDEQTLLEADQHIRDAEAVAAEDEEAAAVQEQICRIRADEEEFETFNLKIIHRKNRFVLLACLHDVFIIVRELILSSRSMPLDRPLDESPN
jgi:hypothetical protein